jgi:hypothetical protein
MWPILRSQIGSVGFRSFLGVPSQMWASRRRAI